MRSERSSRDPSTPPEGAEFSFPVVGVFLTGCDIAAMEFEDDEPQPAYPNRIRKARKARRYNLHEAAERAEMSFQTLQRWETKQPWLPLPKVLKLAEALECSVYDLLPYHPQPMEDPEIAYVIDLMKGADAPTRRAILRAAKGLADREETEFEQRALPKRR